MDWSVEMNVKISRWRNRPGIRLPARLLAVLGASQGGVLVASVQNGALVLSPPGRERYDLDTLVKGITQANLHREVEWEPVKNWPK